MTAQTGYTADFFAAEEGRTPLPLPGITAKAPELTQAQIASAEANRIARQGAAVTTKAVELSNLHAAPGGYNERRSEIYYEEMHSSWLQNRWNEGPSGAHWGKFPFEYIARAKAREDEHKRINSGTDWGLLSFIPGIVATAAAIVATGGAAAAFLGVAASLGGLTAAAATVAGVAKGIDELLGDVQKAQAFISDPVSAIVPTLDVPLLSKGAKPAIDAVTVVADRVLAAAETGDPAAKVLYEATKAKALLGDPDAIAAVAILADVMGKRQSAGMAPGVAQPLNAAGLAALDAYAGMVRKGTAAPATIDLQRGHTGPGVLAWQNFLRSNGQGYEAVPLDSKFGEVTQVKTKSWQRAQGIVPADGIVRADSLARAVAMARALVMQRGHSGPAVLGWQTFLRSQGQGYEAVPLDSKFGEVTQVKTKSWQRAQGIVPADGLVRADSLARADALTKAVEATALAVYQEGAPARAAAAAKLAAQAKLAGGAAPVEGMLIHQDGELAGRVNFSARAWRPCAAGAAGAVRGIVVSPAGRLAFDSADWIPTA